MLSKYCEELNGNFFKAYESTWDTNYFGVRSARAIINKIASEHGFSLLLNFLNEYEFVTIINSNNNHENNLLLSKIPGILLVDINVQYEKDLAKGLNNSQAVIEIYEAYTRDESVLRIASEAFQYSRFYNDPSLPVDKVKKIYSHWVNDAFNKHGRFYSLVKDCGTTTGFLLFSIDKLSSVATIELIAVDKHYRGSRLGKELVAGMEHFVNKRNIDKIKVGTQLDNDSAKQFYVSCGFTYSRCNSIYHYWPKFF